MSASHFLAGDAASNKMSSSALTLCEESSFTARSSSVGFSAWATSVRACATNAASASRLFDAAARRLSTSVSDCRRAISCWSSGETAELSEAVALSCGWMGSRWVESASAVACVACKSSTRLESTYAWDLWR
eukprot:3601644-Prymnesium_polylepis.1